MPAMEAECLFVADEVLNAFPLSGVPAHLINHSKLLDAILEIVPPKQRNGVCEVLVQHGRLQRSWMKTSTELLKLPGVTPSICDALKSVDILGELLADQTRLGGEHKTDDAFQTMQVISTRSGPSS